MSLKTFVGSRVRRFGRSALCLALLCALPCISVEAQELKARVSVKMILDPTGNRPVAGVLFQDSQIENSFRVANEVLAASGADWRLELTEILDLTGVSQWIGQSCGAARNGIENAAMADPVAYAWRDDAINVYISNGLLDCGGICSFPTGGSAILLNNSLDEIYPLFRPPPYEFDDFGNGLLLLHEIGHFFNLCHTHGCCCNCVCLDKKGDKLGLEPVGDDGLEDTLPDLDCWSRDSIAQWSFGTDYAGLASEDQRRVEFTWLNVMSYHDQALSTEKRMFLTADQLAHVAEEMHPVTGRRAHVLNLPRPTLTATPAVVEESQEIQLEAEVVTFEKDRPIVSYEWDLGDGTTAEGKTPRHTYTTPGFYAIRLTVTDDRGLWGMAQGHVTVTVKPGDVSPWLSGDIGEPAESGGARFTESEECLLVVGGPGRLAGPGDALQFVHQRMTGNSQFTARLSDANLFEASSVAGLMMRESLERNSRHASVALQRFENDFIHRFLKRERIQTRFQDRETYEQLDLWLRLERRGDMISGQLSVDGENWTEPDTAEFVDLAEEIHVGLVSASAPGAVSVGTFCDLSLVPLPDVPGDRFLRGDCDADGDACSGVNDALTLLSWVFRGDTTPSCLAACDANGDGETELTDAVFGLDYCFSGTAPPPAPFPGCGPGTEADAALGCETSACE